MAHNVPPYLLFSFHDQSPLYIATELGRIAQTTAVGNPSCQVDVVIEINRVATIFISTSVRSHFIHSLFQLFQRPSPTQATMQAISATTRMAPATLKPSTSSRQTSVARMTAPKCVFKGGPHHVARDLSLLFLKRYSPDMLFMKDYCHGLNHSPNIS